MRYHQPGNGTRLEDQDVSHRCSKKEILFWKHRDKRQQKNQQGWSRK